MKRDTTTGSRRRTARVGLVAGVLAAVSGVALVVAAPHVSGQVTAKAAKGTGNIAVTQTPIASGMPCTTPAGSLSYTVFSDSSIFRLRVHASAPLCAPVTATAVIYAMPGGGEAWPQQLVETKSFTIGSAGVTDIVFTKDCTPAQFDVVTGATPQTISPLGEKHGPLLFPADTNTAYQDPGKLCEPSTSTTTSPNNVTSTTVAATTTAVENTTVLNTTTTTAGLSVLGTTTIASGGSSPRVLDSSSGGSNSPASLAVTGVSSGSTAALGVVLFLLGVVIIVTTRHRALPAVRMITSNSSVNPNSPFGLD